MKKISLRGIAMNHEETILCQRLAPATELALVVVPIMRQAPMHPGGLGKVASRQLECMKVTGQCSSVHSPCSVYHEHNLWGIFIKTLDRAEYFFPKDRFCGWRWVWSQNCPREVLKGPFWIPSPWASADEDSPRFSRPQRETFSVLSGWNPVQIANINVSTSQDVEKISDLFLLVAAPAHHFGEAACLVETNTLRLALALCSRWRSRAESQSFLGIVQSASSILAEDSVSGEWGTVQKGDMLIFSSQAICIIIRSITFLLSSWSHLTWVSARRDKYWTFGWHVIDSEFW